LFALAAIAILPLLLHGYLVAVGQLTWGAAIIGTLRQLASMLIGIMAVSVVGNVFWKGILHGLPLLRRLVWTLTTFYVLVLLLALLNGHLNDLPLPVVEIQGTGSGSTQGRLLGHIDSYWHVVTDAGEIRAIPDDASGIVVIRK
jgi:hypothetical protein